jgi:hypothetical protein
MNSYEKGVFISYAWGEKREEIVDQLDQSLQQRGIRIIRDKRELEYKGSIKEFMERIGHGDCVIVVISDKYLRSPNCMFELVEIADSKKFQGRIFPIILEDANIYEPTVQAGYIKYWENKIKNLRKALNQIERGNTTAIDEQLNLYIRIRSKMSELTGLLRDMNVLTPTTHQESGFSELYEALVKRLSISSIGASSVSQSISDKNGRLVSGIIWEKGKSPFPGLRALGSRENDEEIFFGRRDETEELFRRILDPDCRFLMVVGASGSGKSSLVRAGLLPYIEKMDPLGSQGWLQVTFKPDALGKGDPFLALTVALCKLSLHINEEEISNRLLENPMGLRSVLEERLIAGSVKRRVLLFIDQFEELFTRIKDENLREEFLEVLNDVTTSPNIFTIITIRDDFYHYCIKSPVLSHLINSNSNSTFALSTPGIWQMYSMITGPARIAGLRFDSGLEGRILQDTGRESGALALMSFALEKLYIASGNNNNLTFKAYHSFGGVKGAIGNHASNTFEDLSEQAQQALPHVFRELLDVDESGITTRKRTSLVQVEHDPACQELVQALVNARLLVTSRDFSDQPLVEVAHEALFYSWPELQEWIDVTKDDLILLRQVRTDAQLWSKKGKDKDYRWSDGRLKPVYEMQKRLEPKWNDVEQEFISLESSWLLKELDDPAISHLRRSVIGERLAVSGDSRSGVGLVSTILPLATPDENDLTPNGLRAAEIRLWGDKATHAGLPDIVWLPVRGGSLQIEDKFLTIQPFYISKYQITYRQFQAFVDALDGLKSTAWWEALLPNIKHKVILAEQAFKFDNSPRENVSWYEALAFCLWLNASLDWPQLPLKLDLEFLETYNGIRLPTEWEWQWAATGGKQSYKFPWGKKWSDNNANTFESGLSRSTAVGMYPAGAAPCGAHDMSGNVCEWCLNEYRRPINISIRRNAYRAIRGGSWKLNHEYASAFYRHPIDPDDFPSSDIGFRVVVRQPHS